MTTTSTTTDWIATYKPDPFWDGAAHALFFGCCGITTAATLWFIIINYISPEAYHPLDFYSNHLRMRPHLFFMTLALVIMSAVLAQQTNQISLFLKLMPQVACAFYAQGLAIVTLTLFRVSSAAALMSALLCIVFELVLLLITMIPDIGGFSWFYCSLFLLLSYGMVAWVRIGVTRHLRRDAGKPLVPAGAEVLFVIMDQVISKASPAIAVTLDTAIVLVIQLQDGNYGFAFCVAYAAVSCSLIFGCSREFRGDTEVGNQVV